MKQIPVLILSWSSLSLKTFLIWIEELELNYWKRLTSCSTSRLWCWFVLDWPWWSAVFVCVCVSVSFSSRGNEQHSHSWFTGILFVHGLTCYYKISLVKILHNKVSFIFDMLSWLWSGGRVDLTEVVLWYFCSDWRSMTELPPHHFLSFSP